jgi:hypothetical protein
MEAPHEIFHVSLSKQFLDIKEPLNQSPIANTCGYGDPSL